MSEDEEIALLANDAIYCPFCGCDTCYIGETEDTTYYVACPKCDSCGPVHHFPKMAVDAWNTRVLDYHKTLN